ncbi:MAG TPA: hypothetical protein VK674_06450 [Candidatus Limnocylindria bacterium]|nr:hypothetical protein [Candidatus Limnocylindria bacterium]
MTRRYQIGSRPTRRLRKFFGVVVVSLIAFGGLAGFVLWDMNRSSLNGEVEGEARSVAQKEDVKAAVNQLAADEPFFSFSLPAGWVAVDRRNAPTERSITWHASKSKKTVGHSLKLYIDAIPKDIAVNKLLPVDVAGNTVTYRQISENCKNFTTARKSSTMPQPSKWQGVDFTCDLPNFVQNKVGTAAPGEINAMTITGPTKGKHKYLFVYTDHHNQPDYQVLYTALKTFQAK